MARSRIRMLMPEWQAVRRRSGPLMLAMVCVLLPVLVAAFEVGDRVEASPQGDPAGWLSCEVTDVWAEGSSYTVACGAEQTRYLAQSRWVRAATAGMIQAAPRAIPKQADRPPTQTTINKGATTNTAPPARKIGTKMGGGSVAATTPTTEPKPDVEPEVAGNTGDGSGLPEGHYECWAAGGLAGTLELNIESDSEYSDRAGNDGEYAFNAATREITFQSGPWEGFFGKLLNPRKIGIASRRGGFYGTSCDLQ